jgi:hypothetical protein
MGPPENQGAFRVACALVVLGGSVELGNWGLKEARRELRALGSASWAAPCAEAPPGWGSVLAATSPYHRRAALELHAQLLRHCASGSVP